MIRKCLILILFCISIYSQEERVKLITFDGGGVRGVASLEFAKAIEQYIDSSFYETFDIFAGTSTGAIIAVGLALGAPVAELACAYHKWASTAFSCGTFCTHFFHPQYEADRLEEILIDFLCAHKFSKDSCLKDLPKKVIIPIICLDDSTTGSWRLKVLDNLTLEGGQVKIIDALLEATAAPFYFSSHLGNIDGGLAVNNPALLAFIYSYYPCLLKDRGVALLSIGTGRFPKYIQGDESWGEVQWLTPITLYHAAGSVPLLNLILDVGGQIPEQLCAKFLPQSFRRVNFTLAQDYALDQVDAMPQIVLEAKKYIENHISDFRSIGAWLK